MTIITHSPMETEHLAEKLASQLKPGDVIAFLGGLGAGKTAFTRGLARGLGVCEPVTSPTYTIVNEYTSGKIPLFHFDMYRLTSSEELFEIGWEDYLARALQHEIDHLDGILFIDTATNIEYNGRRWFHCALCLWEPRILLYSR